MNQPPNMVNEFAPKTTTSLEILDVIEIDDSIVIDAETNSDVICLDDSKNSSQEATPTWNSSEFYRLRAELDLTSELYRIKDHYNVCVTIPKSEVNLKRKRKRDSITNKRRKVSESEVCFIDADETVIIEDDSPTFNDSLHSESKVNENTISSSNHQDSSKEEYDHLPSDLSSSTSSNPCSSTSCLSSPQSIPNSSDLSHSTTNSFKPYKSLIKLSNLKNSNHNSSKTVRTENSSLSKKKKKKSKRKKTFSTSSDPDCILIDSSFTNPCTNRNDELTDISEINLNSVPNETSGPKKSSVNLTSSSVSSKKNSCDTKSSRSAGEDVILLCPANKSESGDKDITVVIDDAENKNGSVLDVGKNVCVPTNSISFKGLRPVIIDGSNVAFSHGISSSGEKKFSSKGIEICINYFVDRGHKVITFVPLFRKTNQYTLDSEILEKLAEKGHITFTPSRRVNSKLSVPYDDRYIVQCAAALGGVIVSTDNYRDLLLENEAWRTTIESRLLMFTFIGDMLMFPQDPLGRHGPNLDDFLRFPE